ncbi:O-antigen ligase family protein [Geosporobacter ferrireducens]|uniref:O-antigen ligase-related domain-containing protein n=1 Tax=Geosporobacter ferrireducens TaxID=1424294 RepID=A0A1D8GGU8_9FIRM|nr:O-antigen ligase family protein [Geosporobacter ferrireducens]AOT70141.1 hypothetical protein Gferi_11385 [Geosporobacter ferrireducens]
MISKSANERKNKTGIKEKSKIELIVLLLSILIFSLPFFKGLFFTREILITHIVSFTLSILYLANKTLKREKISFDNGVDYIGLFFIIVYLLPIVFGKWANLRDAIGITLRYVNCFIIYLMVKDYVRDEKCKDWVLNVLIASGVTTAGIGILGAAGYVQLQDVVLSNRMASTFQYPNTLAAFMMTLLFITLGKLYSTDKLWQKIVYAVSGFIMLFVFVFTYSRGAWLLLPIFVLLYMLALAKEKKVQTILYFIVALIPIILLLQPITKNLLEADGNKSQGLLYTFLAIGIFTGPYILIDKMFTRIKETQYKYIYISLTSLMLGVVGLLLLAFNATEPLTFDNYGLTENRTNQIQRVVHTVQPDEEYLLKLNLEAATENERQWPWRVRVMSIGATGEAQMIAEQLGEIEQASEIEIPFQTLAETKKLQIYLTNTYSDTKVTFNAVELINIADESIKNINLHYKYIPESFITRLNNINMQDNSSSARLTFYKDGFSMFKDHMVLGAGGGAWKGLYRQYQSEIYDSTEAHNYFIQTMVEVGSLGIILLFLMIGCIVVTGFKAVKEKDTRNISMTIAILSLLAHSVLDFNFSYLSILILLWVFLGMLPQIDLPHQIKREGFARKIHPLLLVAVVIPIIFFTGFLYIGNASAREAAAYFKSGHSQEGVVAFDRAVKADPFDATYRIDMAQILRNISQQNQNQQLLLEAEEHLKKAIQYAPYNDLILSQAALHYLNVGQFDEALPYADKVIEVAPAVANSYEIKTEIYNAVARYYLENNNKKQALETYSSILEVVNEIRIANNKTQNKKLILTDKTIDQLNVARYHVDEKDREIQDINKIFYFALDTDENGLTDNWKVYNYKDANIITEVADDGIKISNTGAGTGFIYSTNFELKPSTKYKMELKLNSTIDEDFAVIKVISRNGKTTQFAQKLDMGMAAKNAFAYEFETSEEIQSGDQYIRIDHLGNSEKSIDINRLILLESKP